MTILRWTLRIAGAVFLLPVLLSSIFILYCLFSPAPSFKSDALLKQSDRIVVESGSNPAKQHNAFPDMTEFKGELYMVHTQAKWHMFDKNRRLAVLNSKDGRNWKEISQITLPGKDPRDAKIVVIRDKLFIYFAANEKFDPLPYATFRTSSTDGRKWSEPVKQAVFLRQKGKSGLLTETADWLLWRPRIRDNKKWYVIAHGMRSGFDYRVSALFESSDGLRWDEVSAVYDRHETWEQDMIFRGDGSIIAVSRCEKMDRPSPGLGFTNPDGNTVISVSAPPYKAWKHSHSFITRLDGATLFSEGKRIFAVGRNHQGPRDDMGNPFNEKRTALYEVMNDRLLFLSDFPSTGDTGYTGAVSFGNEFIISYYSTVLDSDMAWVLGMCFFPKADIRVSGIDRAGLLSLADIKLKELKKPEAK